MPTKLDQSQIDGLSDDLNSLDSIDESLESKISTEDSINDQVDVTLQEQIDDVKGVLLSFIFGNRLDVMVDGPDLIVMTPTQFPITVTSITWVWLLNNEPIADSNSNIYRPLESGTYKASVTYQTILGPHYIESDPITVEMPK
jgi:hypothetical protein